MQRGIVLRTENTTEVTRALQKLEVDANGAVCRPYQKWPDFTDEERKIVDEMFGFHPTTPEEAPRGGYFERVTDDHRPISFREGDVGLVLTIDDLD